MFSVKLNTFKHKKRNESYIKIKQIKIAFDLFKLLKKTLFPRKVFLLVYINKRQKIIKH